jgi:SAM-dependent methyltransferase
MVREKLLVDDLPPKLRERAEADVEYRVHHSEDKEKFVLTAAPFLAEPPQTIMDLGGGQGGTLTSFRRRYQPRTPLLVDLDPEMVEIARLRDPDTEVVRGDALRLPLPDGGIDFLVSTATLEHIPDWRKTLDEMARVACCGLISYGPNAIFPYDFGHLDAPLVTWLPDGPGAHAAHCWHRLRRTGRTMESIRNELNQTFYIPRTAVVRQLKSQGLEVDNVFAEFLRHSVRESYHMRAGGLKRLLARQSWLRELFARFFLVLGAEPNVYLFFRRPLRA